MLPPAAFNDGPPVTPRPSATVMLVREGDPWELLMVQRPGGADFAPSAWVFPGGTVTEEDMSSDDELRAAARRELFEEAGIRLASHHELLLFARWVTPAQVRRRYDARFYLARLPEGQAVTPQEGEVIDWRWMTPMRALADPDVTLVYATRAVLESVHLVPDVDSLFAWARDIEEVRVVEPRIVQTETGWEIVRD